MGHLCLLGTFQAGNFGNSVGAICVARDNRSGFNLDGPRECLETFRLVFHGRSFSLAPNSAAKSSILPFLEI